MIDQAMPRDLRESTHENEMRIKLANGSICVPLSRAEHRAGRPQHPSRPAAAHYRELRKLQPALQRAA
jgi:hypothetical protein